jgi:hypothetical protein
VNRVVALLFLLGATVGSALDAIHTHSGTTVYTHIVGWQMAWWTPPLFGLAGLSTGTAYPLMERVTKRQVPDTSWARALGGFALFAALYFASGYLPASNVVKLVVLLAGAAVLFATVARAPLALGVAVIAAIVGPVVEIVLVSQNQFRHLQPDVAGIPIWLPALYASGSIAFGVVGKKIATALTAREEPRAPTVSSVARSLP